MRTAESRADEQVDIERVRAIHDRAFPTAQIILDVTVHRAFSIIVGIDGTDDDRTLFREIEGHVGSDGITGRPVGGEQRELAQAHNGLGGIEAHLRCGNRGRENEIQNVAGVPADDGARNIDPRGAIPGLQSEAGHGLKVIAPEIELGAAEWDIERQGDDQPVWRIAVALPAVAIADDTVGGIKSGVGGRCRTGLDQLKFGEIDAERLRPGLRSNEKEEGEATAATMRAGVHSP